MFYHSIIKLLMILFLALAAVSCSKEGYVISNTALFEDEKLSKKQNIMVHRGDIIKIIKCSKTACQVNYLGQYEGFLAIDKLLNKKSTKIVTFVRDGELKKEPDLMGATIKKVEAGTRGFLIGEQKRWSLVDIDTSRGWVLMDKLFQGESPFKLYIPLGKLTLEFNGKWYIPFVSAERFFSLEKAFDNNPVSFSIVRKDELVTVLLKNYESSQQKYVLTYTPPKEMNYRNLSLPQEMELSAPFTQIYPLKEEMSFEFEGNVLSFRITKSEKDMVYLNNFSISVKN